MESLVFSFVSAVTGPGRSDGDDEKITIIVPQSHAYLADLLGKAFEGRGDVEVVVDRRRADRRKGQQPISVERRHRDRRRAKDEVIEVVLGKVSRVGWPPTGSP